MKKELANEFVSKIEANIKAIESVIKENLGIEIPMRVVTSGRENINVKIEEFESEESKKVLTSHPLLRQMFSDSVIVVRAWYNEEKNLGSFLVDIFYEHNFGRGSNGTELLMFNMDMATGKVTAIKK